MKYIFTLLLFVSQCFGEVQSFRFPMNDDTSKGKKIRYSATTSWSAVVANSTGTNGTGYVTDTLWCGRSGSTWVNTRMLFFSDSLPLMLDSFLVALGKYADPCSLVFYFRMHNAIYDGTESGCNPYIYLSVGDSCATMIPATNTTIVGANPYGYATRATWAGIPDVADSFEVDTTVMGLSDTVWASFAVTGQVLESIICRAELGVWANIAIPIWLRTCFDQYTVDPDGANPRLRVLVEMLDSTTPPYGILYYDELLAGTGGLSGRRLWRGGW